MKRFYLIAALIFFSLCLSLRDNSSYAENNYSPKNRHIVFSKNIAPLVFKNCTPCHRPGQVAPFPLMTYNDVRRHSKEIVALTASRQMPPWKAKHGYGNFAGERRLSDNEIKMIAQWVASGMELG